MSNIANNAPAGNERERTEPYFPFTLKIFNDISRLAVSPSAQAVLLYIVRHTVGWQRNGRRNQWVTLKIKDFIRGRPSSGQSRYDNGIGIKAHRTVEEALEELGVKGFIFELDEGRNDGSYTFGLQWMYYADYADLSAEYARRQPTPKYRYISNGAGSYNPKPDEEQTPHYYGQPRKKATSVQSQMKNSLEINDVSLKMNNGREKLTSTLGKINEQERLEGRPEAARSLAERKRKESKVKESRTESFDAVASGAPDVAPTSSLKNVSVDDENEATLITAKKAEMASVAELGKQTTRQIEPIPPLEPGVSAVVANECREEPKQSARQDNQEADNVSMQPVPAMRPIYDKQQWAEMIRRQAATLAAKPADTPQDEPESEVPLSDEAQTVMREAATRPDNITELRSPKKKGREGKIASYRAFIETQRQNVAEWQERVRNGSGWWLESRITDALRTIADYEMAVRALENGLPVDVAQQIAQGKMAMLPEAVQQQVQMYIS